MTSPTLALVGAGRLGSSLARALGSSCRGPFGRGFDGLMPSGVTFDAVLLCVPDGEIAAAADAVAPGPLVGHCSGARGLEALGERPRFSLHPLMTVLGADAPGARPDVFAGAAAAVDGSSEQALEFARGLALELRMEPIAIEPSDRAAYHAAASIASNFLITLEAAAERAAASAGVERRLLVPLVRQSVENWASLGGERALTGPILRGDLETVESQRQAVQQRMPELTELYDALVDATARLAAGRRALA